VNVYFLLFTNKCAVDLDYSDFFFYYSVDCGEDGWDCVGNEYEKASYLRAPLQFDGHGMV
jgi:hypothetical protein